MDQILVSSCFNANPLFALAVLCPESSKLSFVDLSGVPNSVYFRGISGLAKIPGGFVAGLQSNGLSKLLFLDDHLNYRKVVDLRLTYDVHSMVYVDGQLYIVSTGNDSVVRYDLASTEEEIVRAFAQGESDTLHINGICSYQGRLFVSMFGMQTKKSMRLGSVVAVDTGETVVSGLRHPHSLMSDGSSLMIAESLTGTLVRFNLDGIIDQSCVAALESIAGPSAAQALMLSRARFELGDLNLSWSLAQEIYIHHPQFAENLHWMSKLQELRGEFDLAMEYAEKAVSLNASVAGYVFQLGEIYRRLGRFEAATIQLKRAIELNPRLELAQKSLAAADARLCQDEQLGAMGTLQRLTDWRAV